MTETDFKIATSNRALLGYDKEHGGDWKEPFIFIQAADSQYGMMAGYHENKRGKDNVWDAEIALTEECVRLVNAMQPRPKFFIICGDLVDAHPGDPNKEAQEADFKRIFSKVHPDIPLVCVCGNHDIGNTPTQDSINNYKNNFGDDYFSFWIGGVKFIVLNSQLYKDDTQVKELRIAQDEWLEEELKDGKKAQHLVIFQHIPIFIKDPDEPNDYYNFDLAIRKPLLEKLNAAGVRSIFCGHYHQNAGFFYGDMEVIVTSAIGAQLGEDPHGMRVVKVCEGSIKHQYYGLEDMPTNINL